MFGPFGASLGGSATATALYQGQPPLNLHYRQLQQSDYDALKAIHRDLFPIDYEEVFFRKAVAGEDRVFSWAAVHNEYGRDYLVGFVTARLVYLYECDPLDRQVMGLTSRCLDGEGAVYVLTLGVVPACRQCGIARSLLGLVQQHAARLRCRAIFLHVISYNTAAMRLYGTSGYQPMARLPNFYHLITGRQPDPDQAWYDAFLYALFIPHNGPEPSPAMQWAGGVLGAAVAPLRSMLGTFNGCIPAWFCRQTYSTFLPFAGVGGGGGGGGGGAGGVSQRSASKGSLADTATSAWQQQQQQPLPSPSPQSHLQTQQQLLLQQQPLPVSNAAGVVCPGVTADQFLRRGAPQQQHHHHHHPQHLQQRCNGGSGGGAGPGQHFQQQQQLYNTGPVSYGLDPGGGGGGGTSSSAASSASASGDPNSLLLGASPPTPPPLAKPPPHPQLRPPSPPVPPCPAPSLTSLQQRHPHGGSGSAGSGASTPPPHANGGGPNGHHRSHHSQHQQHQFHNHSHHHNHIHGGNGSGGGGGAHGRNGEHSRGGLHRGGPHGLAGGGLQPPTQYQQQLQQSQLPQQPKQQQQSSSMLSMLFRPPTAQQHPHSR